MAAQIRLRTDQFRKVSLTAKLLTDAAIAEHMKVDAGNLSRILRGVVGPGEKFIAATLIAFPAFNFEDLFQVLDTDTDLAA